MSGKCSKYFLPILVLLFMPFSLFAETKYEKATFAGGCFWCMEHPFETLSGVSEVLSGYTGGRKKTRRTRRFRRGQPFILKRSR